MKEELINLFPNWKYLDLSPYQAGYSENTPNSSFGPCARIHYLFHYVISGAGTLAADDETGKAHWFRVHSGQGFMIFPDQITTYWADQDHPWEYVWIEFDGMYAKEVIRQSGLSIDSPVYHSVDKALTADMLNCMLELAEKSDDTQFYKLSKLYQFADCLIRSSKKFRRWDASGTMSDYYLQTAFSYIEHNFMNPITVESIAQQCNIHRNRLLKIFKDSIGKSPQEYLISYRMSKASQLLTTTKLSINEIGNAIGYPNQLHFSRAFKNIYGVSPKKYREENMNYV